MWHMIKIMFSEDVEPNLPGFAAYLFTHARTLHRSAGSTLFRQGQRPAWMYYILRGEAQMLRFTAAGAPVILQRARHGFIAEASLTSERYHCDGVCRTDCQIVAFALSHLRNAIDTDHATRRAWIGLPSAQGRQQRARIEGQSLKTIRERLRHLVHTEGSIKNGYQLPGTKLELAAELGVTPEALYRCLANMQEDGVLSIEGRRFKLTE